MDIYATASAHIRDLVSRLGAVAIDYRSEDFVARIRYLVARRIPLSEASRAHQLLEQGGHAGKFVLVP